MKRLLYITFVLAFAALSLTASAQSSAARKDTRKGNREYKSKHYDKAEVNYRRALHDDSSAYRADYNLGNTLYRQKKYDEAAQHFDRALQYPKLSNKEKSRILHNRGNSYLKAGLDKESRGEGMELFQKAVNDYQEALKLAPKNEDTRYNLSYAKKMLQQAQQQNKQNNQNNQGGGQGDQDKDKDKNKDKNKDGNNGQNQDQNKQNQDQGNQQNQQNKQNQDQKPQDKQQQKQQQQKKQDAERLLEAVKNNEKKTMKDNAKKVEVAAPARIEKDW